MATLAAGVSTTITLQIGQIVTFEIGGSGVVTDGTGNFDQVGATIRTFGPYPFVETLYISASQALTYTTFTQPFTEDASGYIPVRQDVNTGLLLGSNGLAVAGAVNFNISVACGLLGQSLPFGAVTRLDPDGNLQKQYYSAPSQVYVEPDRYAPGASGSYFVPALQQLGLEGIKVFWSNTALGGISLIFDVCGTIDVSNGFGGTGWRPNRAYRGKRASLASGDPGTKGEFILESGRVWEATTGCTHLAFIDSDTPVTVGGVAWRRQLTSIAKNTDRTSANSGAKPVFSASAIVGDTVVDNGAGSTGGGIVWTCVAVASPAADASGVRVARNADLYWDPYGIALRARNAVVGQPVGVFYRYMIVVGTVQADAGQSATLTRLAHQLITTYNAADSVKTIHSMCLFYPQKTQADYDAYETVLSGGGLASAENYAASLLTTNLTGSGYTLGVPGTTTRASSTVFYYMKSLYRHFGTDVLSMLQTPQPNPHVTQEGGQLCAAKWVAPLRSIFRNEALTA